MLFVYYLIFSLLFILILRPFSTLLHELGHGIPALLFTNQKVTLYLGSYGDPKESFSTQIGRLELYFNKNPFNWKVGLCVLEQNALSINKLMFIFLMGPLVSLILSLILSYLIFFSNLNDHVKMVLLFFNISTYYDFLVNIIPSNKPIELHNGTSIFNDGQQIIDLFKLKKIPKEYEMGIEKYNDKKFAEAIILFEKVYAKGFQEGIIHKLLIVAYIQVKDYVNALRFNNLYISKFRDDFDSNDYTNSGLLRSFSGEYESALIDYNKAIKLDPNNVTALNNRGYNYNMMKDYENAVKDFDKAISLENDYAYSLNNRGLAKVKLGLKKEGLLDLEKSMKLNNTNSYCYLNYGIYHYDNLEYKKALEYFNKAKELDSATHELESYLKKVHEKLSS